MMKKLSFCIRITILLVWSFSLRAIALPDLEDGSTYYHELSSTLLAPGDNLTVRAKVENEGDSNSQSFVVKIYASLNTSITSGDEHLATINMPPLAPDGYARLNENLTLPVSITPATYYIGWIIDANNEVVESIEGNNTTFISSQLTIQAGASSTPNLSYFTHAVKDGINPLNGLGNGDGLMNPGEEIDLDVTLYNQGTRAAELVKGYLSTTSKYITITDNDISWGTILSGDTDNGLDFDFDVSPVAIPGSVIDFELTLTSLEGDWSDTFELVVYGDGTTTPSLHMDNFLLDDSAGNGDSFANPGESINLDIQVNNIGGGTASNITGTLSTIDAYANITDASGIWPDINAASFGINNNGFSFDLSPSTPADHLIPFTLLLTSAEGTWTNEFELPTQLLGAMPEAELRSGVGYAQVIFDGDTLPSVAKETDFGSVSLGEYNANIFRMYNTGSSRLKISYANITGNGTAHFRNSSIDPIIEAGDYDSFSITFEPKTVGLHEATFTIYTDDSDENEYNFLIRGNANLSTDPIEILEIEDRSQYDNIGIRIIANYGFLYRLWGTDQLNPPNWVVYEEELGQGYTFPQLFTVDRPPLRRYYKIERLD